MGAVPTTDNAAADFVNNVINILITGGEDAAKAYIAAQAPVLEGPIVGVLTNEALSLIGDAIDKAVAIRVDAVVIQIQTGNETSGVNQTYQQLQAAKASGDSNAYDAALAAFAKAAASLAHGDGISNNT